MAIKIGFDAKRAFNNHSGLGVYSRELITAVQRLLPETTLILFSPKIKKDIFRITENSKLKIENSRWGFLWRSLLIYFDIKKSNLDVYHGLAGELPFWIPQGVKKIVTIHDVLFERFPEDYPWIDRKIYAWKAKYACKTADIIIAVSEATKRDLIDFYQINASKIKVIPVGVNFDVKLNTKRTYSREYMVCISSFLPRKNQSLLIDAFQMIADKMDIDLIFIGSGSYWNEVKKKAENSPFTDRIIFIKKISDEDKFSYLSHAKFSVYLSKYEGFGIPIIESFAYSIPIIISDSEIHKEVASDAAIYFQNENAKDLANKLFSTYHLSELEREIFIQKGQTRVEKFKSENVYLDLINVYQLK